jgi:uncharacterized protein (DUF305 family)
MRDRIPRIIALLFVIPLAVAPTVAGSQSARPGPAEAAYLAQTRAAMGRMMSAMQIAPTGDVDADFAAAMIPHHQGAMEMAQAELRYGKDKQLRAMAQGIIDEQRQQIVTMRAALKQVESGELK